MAVPKPLNPENGNVFQQELLRFMRGELHESRELNREIKVVLEEVRDELAALRMQRSRGKDRRKVTRSTADRRLSDRKGAGEKRAAQRK